MSLFKNVEILAQESLIILSTEIGCEKAIEERGKYLIPIEIF